MRMNQTRQEEKAEDKKEGERQIVREEEKEEKEEKKEEEKVWLAAWAGVGGEGAVGEPWQVAVDEYQVRLRVVQWLRSDGAGLTSSKT